MSDAPQQYQLVDAGFSKLNAGELSLMSAAKRSNSWRASVKWLQRRQEGGHGIVRLDVFCGQCEEQIAEDILPADLKSYGLHTDRPMDVFCSLPCMAAREAVSAQAHCSLAWGLSREHYIGRTEAEGWMKSCFYSLILQ